MVTQPGGFDFEEMRRMLQQMGIMGEDGQLDLNKIMQRMQQMPPGAMFGMTNADQDPDAAWRTTITAAKQLTTETAPDPALLPEERKAVDDAERLAQSWLDEFTEFSSTRVPARSITRTEWLDGTSEGWRGIVEPIMEGLTSALERSSSDSDQEGVPPELSQLQEMMLPMMRTSASMMYRDRLKRELSSVASDTLTGTEIGFNLFDSQAVVIIPNNVAQFTRDLDADSTDMMLVLLVREAARQRLFHSAAWLSPQLTALMAHYAREIKIDLDSIAEKLSPESLEGVSMEEIAKMGEEVRGSFFRPASTETQLEILERLGVLLALVDGWVEHVSNRVFEKWMPHAPQLTEMLRRRRAAGGPVTTVLQDLIGLEISPRLLRDASNLWASIEHDRGQAERDGLWSHPDLLPRAKHLEDPLSFTDPSPETTDDLDEELRKLLEE